MQKAPLVHRISDQKTQGNIFTCEFAMVGINCRIYDFVFFAGSFKALFAIS
jgi:hypothetical protein